MRYPEEPLRPLDRERLEAVDDLLALVVALARIALRVLVREHAPERLEHRARDVVLRRDQADRLRLSLKLGFEQQRNLGIGAAKSRLGQDLRAHRGHLQDSQTVPRRTAHSAAAPRWCSTLRASH